MSCIVITLQRDKAVSFIHNMKLPAYIYEGNIRHVLMTAENCKPFIERTECIFVCDPCEGFVLKMQQDIFVVFPGRGACQPVFTRCDEAAMHAFAHISKTLPYIHVCNGGIGILEPPRDPLAFVERVQQGISDLGIETWQRVSMQWFETQESTFVCVVTNDAPG
jgi:hypothetical protein